jgi:DNA-binding transcriptional MerR regulator
MKTVSSARFEAITGITPGRLQRWAEAGILTPTVNNHERRFTKTDALRARFMLELARRGYDHRELYRPLVHKIVREAESGSTPAKDLLVLITGTGKNMPGGRVALTKLRPILVPRQIALEVIREQCRPGFIIDYGEATKGVRDSTYFKD